MISSTVIDTLYNRNTDLLQFLDSQRQVTFRSDFDDLFKKNLVLAIASYFESEICSVILRFAEGLTNGNDALCSFVQQKGISRQFHTYFSWGNKNANAFFALFGQRFRSRCEGQVKADENLDNAVRAFLELGDTRNSLVHLNFASYQLPKTSQEYYELYQRALGFIDFLKRELPGSRESQPVSI